MKPEAKVKKKVKATLDKLGAYYFMPFMGGYGAAGVPDIVACYKGRFFGIECKGGGGRTTALQVKNLNEIGRCGGIPLVINEENVDQLEEIIHHEIQSNR
jgi:hypothetical protein